ncbi:MAG: Panacea domain-containing protein [Defluviitaleaceae bacterium]|nr:Panacea domain-containing protein [Defluviitaleaceae bacterium]
MSDSLAISNNILRLAFRDNIEVTPMKLQKLLYLLYARYLHLGNEPLFSSRFEVWKYGPVLRDIYNHFKDFGARPINGYAEIDGKALVLDESVNDLFKEALELTWDRFKDFSGQQLSALTHLQGTAWHIANGRGDRFLRDEEVVLDGGYRFWT